MLSKTEFVNAMRFFDEFDYIRDRVTYMCSTFFDGNGFLFTGNDGLLDKYLNLLKRSMNIPLDEEYDPISYWLWEADEYEYSEPDSQGICKRLNKTDAKFWDVQCNDKKFRITNDEELYDYIKYCYGD